MIKTLYGKDSKGGFKEWHVSVVDDEIHVTHGKLGGKMQTKVTKCVGKNVGKANETTPEEQALLEAESKYKKQLDKLYRPTVEELESVGNNLPMLAHDYTKVGYRMEYPLYASPKLDGVRCLVRITSSSITFTSRGGKEYIVPRHISEELSKIHLEGPELILDGELYLHGMSLQNIVSAVKNKDNPDHYRMQFHVFDIPSELPWEERYYQLLALEQFFSFDSCIQFVHCTKVEDEEQAREHLQKYMDYGFEGLMLRSISGAYTFNHRSSDLMKWKEFQDIEAKAIDCRIDKLGEGVLLCRLPVGIEFECKMRGTHATRLYEEQRKLIGKWITVRFQQYTDAGVPQFPVGTGVRNCDAQGNPLE